MSGDDDRRSARHQRDAGDPGPRGNRIRPSRDGVRPSRWMELLLRAVLTADETEHLLGDLREEHAARACRLGRRAAEREYRRDVRELLASRLRARGGYATDALRRQLRHGFRALARRPVFTVATVSTLAVGLGGAATIAGLARSVLRPLPFPESDRLVAVRETLDGTETPVAPANYLDWRRELASFDGGLAAHRPVSTSLTVDGTAFRARIAVVSGNYFNVLGVDLALGRGFDPSLDTAFPERHAIVSHRTWTDRFGSDPGILGRTFLVEDQQYQIVGVAPDGLASPEPGLVAWLRSPTEAPEIRALGDRVPTLRDAWYFAVVGRLVPSATLEGAREELAGLASRLERLHPDTNERRGALLRPLLDETTGDFRPILTSLAAAVLLLLMASAVNMTHLAYSRWADTAGERAVRVALGAGRAAVVGPVVVEGAILGLAGALAGYGLAHAALAHGVSAFPDVVPRAAEVTLGAAAVIAVVSVGMGLGIGISLVAFGVAGGHGAAGRRVAVRGRGLAVRHRGAVARRLGAAERIGGWRGQGLIAAQTAAAIALLASAALLGRSLWSLARVDLGFDVKRVATVRIAQPDARLRSYAERIAAYEDLRARVTRLPGIGEVAFAARSPLTMGLQAGLRVEGWERPDPPGNVSWAPVHHDHFRALGIPLVAGRLFGPSDRADAAHVAVVNEALARSVFPGGDPVGRVVTIGLDGHDRPLTIVGVVGDTRTRGPAAPPGPVLFRPITQTDRFSADAVLLIARTGPVGATDGGGPTERAAGQTRSVGQASPTGWPAPAHRAEPSDLARIQETLRAARPDMPVYDAALGVDLAGAFGRSQASLLGIVGVFALATTLLGAVGVYGVAAHATRRRRREIGVRMALGADGRRVLGTIVGRGLARAALGIPFGVLASLAVGRGLRSLLVGVRPYDPAVLASVCGIVLLVTACALFVPAREAARTDPADATRAD